MVLKELSRGAAPLALLRAKHGFTQRTMANRLKVSYEYLCRVERGQFKPSLRIVKRLARYYDLTPEQVERILHRTQRLAMEAALKAHR